MSIHNISRDVVITAPKSMPIQDAAKLMKENNIGNIVVVENEAENKPIGILTDRDIATKIVADGLNPKNLCVCDAMSSDLLILKKHQGINEALEMMCAKGVRRAPIIDDNNKICGVTAVDDLLVLIADELGSLAKLVRKQATH